MTKHKTAKQIEEELAKQNRQDYGDEAPGGHMESLNADDDVDNRLRALGDDAVEDAQKGEYDFSTELDEDEKQASGITDDYQSEKLLEKDKRKKKAA